MTDELDAELRAAVLALVKDAPALPPFPVARRSRRRTRRGLLVAVAACACAAVAFALLAFSAQKRDRASTIFAADPPPTTSTAAAPASTCGAQPPGELWAPVGYTGPQPGLAADNDTPPGPGQLVMHWTGRSGSIELRWPADPTMPDPFGRPLAVETVGPARITSGAGFGPRQVAGGPAFRDDTVYVVDGAVPDEACRLLQITVFDTETARVEATVEWLRRSPFRPTEPLVASSRVTDSAPTIGRCRPPAGVAAPQNRQGEGEGAAFASPEAALAHFVETRRTVRLAGYVEFRLPDGTVAYGNEVSGQWVTVVHVVPTAAGWTVTGYEVTGC